MLIKIRNHTKRPADQAGFTLVEVAGILLALGILVAVLVPNIGRFNSLARSVRVREDLGAICSSLKVMLDDLGLSAFWGAGAYGGTAMTGFATSGSSTIIGGGMDVSQSTEMIEWCVDCDMPAAECGECGDDCGDDCRDDCGPDCGSHEATVMVPVTTQTYTPTPGQRVTTGRSTTVSYSGAYGYGGYYARPLGLMAGLGRTPASAIGYTEWQSEPGATFARSTIGYNPLPVNFWIGSLGNQLIHHNPTYYGYASGYGYGGGAYGAGYGTGGVHSMMFRWRGPYIADEIIADPWGNRYMVNSFALHVPSSLGGYGVSAGYGRGGYAYGQARYVAQFGSATVCYSAGPNGTIETPFDQPAGWYTGGDDLTVVLAGAGGIR
jgi:hypothetical protein